MTVSFRKTFLFTMFAALVAACGGGRTSMSIDASSTCTSDDQCPVGTVCQGGFCVMPSDAGLPPDGATPPNIVVTPSVLDFGSPLLGVDTSMPVQIGNIGTGPLHVSMITVFENDALPEYAAAPVGMVNLTIMPSQAVMVQVTLHPLDNQADIGELRITSDDPDTPLSVVSLTSDLKGTPNISAIPTTISYGTVSFGTTTTRDVDVTNIGTGNAPLALTALSITNTTGMGSVYSWQLFSVAADGTETSVTLPQYLSAGDMLTLPDKARIRVSFTATTGPGPAPAENLVITSNDPDEGTKLIPISGTVTGCSMPVPEICDGLDNNCNLTADEGDPGGGGVCSTGLGGVCNPGVLHCVSGSLTCVPNITPGSMPETCNNIDDNCNGMVDEGLTQACSTACGTGIAFCSAGAWVGCTAPPVNPETCNNVDDNCNGLIDDGDPGGGGACATGQPGICASGTQHCVSGSISCVQNMAATTEVCNGLDDNCNAMTDEGNPGGGGACATGNVGVCASGTMMCISGGLSCVGITPGSQAEICDGQDNNCNGATDEMDPNISCPAQNPVAGNVSSWACSGGACAITGCQGGHSNPDGTASDGCECTTDANASTCATAGTISVASGTTADVSGKIETDTSSDWFAFSFTAPGAPAGWHPQISFTDDGGGQFRMDVIQGDCASGMACGSEGGSANFVSSWENVYSYTAGPGCCADAMPKTTSVRVRVYRTGGAATCSSFTIHAANP